MNIKQLIVTGAIAGFVVVGGMQLAGAQETPEDTTTTTVVEEPREGCDKDGDGIADDTETTETAPSPEA